MQQQPRRKRMQRMQQRSATMQSVVVPEHAASRMLAVTDAVPEQQHACSFPGCWLHPCLQFRNRLHPCLQFRNNACIHRDAGCIHAACNNSMLLAFTWCGSGCCNNSSGCCNNSKASSMLFRNNAACCSGTTAKGAKKKVKKKRLS